MEISSGNLKEDRALGYIEVAIAHLIKEDKLSFIQSRALSSLVEIVANCMFFFSSFIFLFLFAFSQFLWALLVSLI